MPARHPAARSRWRLTAVLRAVLLIGLLGLAACGDSATPRNELPGPGPVPGPAPLPPPVTPPLSTSKASCYASPAGSQTTTTSTTINGLSAAILPTGRIVTPAGTEVAVGAPKPFELAVSPDGRYVATANSGTSSISVTLVGPLPATTAKTLALDAVYLGIQFSPDSKRFYVSGGDDGVIWIGDTASQSIVGSVNLNGGDQPSVRPLLPTTQPVGQPGPFLTRLILSPDGSRLYALDEDGFQFFVIDTTKIQTGVDGNGAITEPDNFAAVLGAVKAGRHPYGIGLSADGSRLFVANVGIYQYSSYRPANPVGDSKIDYPVCFPPAGWPEGTLNDLHIRIKPVETTTDKLPASTRDPEGIRCGYVAKPIDDYLIPALGDPNVIESSSVWVFATDTGGLPQPVKQVRTGAAIGQIEDGIKTTGGDHPNAIAVGRKAVYVSNGVDDSISVLDPVSYAELRRIPLSPLTGYDSILKGVQPWDLALSPDESRLYVAEAGLNAVGVIDLAQGKVVGHLPTGWWTSAVGLSADGKTLYAASARNRGKDGCGLGNISADCSSAASTPGALHVIALPDAAGLAAGTAQVLANNGLNPSCTASTDDSPIPSTPGVASSQIKHVVVIKKENQKFDHVLGDILITRSGQRVNSQPLFNLTGARVGSPNHHELALSFAFADNYYTAGSVSADGHRWLQGGFTTEWEEGHWNNGYGGQSRDSGSNPAVFKNYPGRLTNHGSDSGPEPHDSNKHGDLYDHLARNGASFFNFGMGFEFSELEEPGWAVPTGAVMHVNVPLSKTLLDRTDHMFPTFNTSIPDSPLPDNPTRFNRYSRFEQVFKDQFLSADGLTCKLPQYVDIYYENDHGGGANNIEPNWTGIRYLQDNDAAVGMTVDLISHSPCWKDTVIFMIEDDAQSGIDHVSPFRSLMIAISPWVKRQHVSHVNLTGPGLNKTVYEILGLPPLNLYDAAATDFRDLFTTTPDYRPYSFITPLYQPTGLGSLSSAAARPALLAQLEPLAAYQPQRAADAARWQELVRDVDFSKPDADECRLNRALIRYFGIPHAPMQAIPQAQLDACLSNRRVAKDDDD